jgi:signal peptidase II
MKFSTQSKLCLFGAAALVLALDQGVTFWVVRNLPLYTPVDIFPWLKPVLSFTYITNRGVAFGLFPQLSTLLKFLPLGVIALIFLFRRSIVVTRPWIDLALGIITGGALGNLCDRLFRGGSVVDFLDVNFWPFRQWPVFQHRRLFYPHRRWHLAADPAVWTRTRAGCQPPQARKRRCARGRCANA